MPYKSAVVGIYGIKNLINQKKYIGSSNHVQRRKNDHFLKLRKGKHTNIYLQSAFNKYGEENFQFEILEECKVTELLAREQYYMDIVKACDRQFGYNLQRDAYRKQLLPISEETRNKLRNRRKGKDGNVLFTYTFELPSGDLLIFKKSLIKYCKEHDLPYGSVRLLVKGKIFTTGKLTGWKFISRVLDSGNEYSIQASPERLEQMRELKLNTTYNFQLPNGEILRIRNRKQYCKDNKIPATTLLNIYKGIPAKYGKLVGWKFLSKEPDSVV